MYKKNTRMYCLFLTLMLIVAAAGCVPRPTETALTTAAPFSEESPANYEQFEEKRLEEQKRFSQLEADLFKEEISNSQIDLHFLLKDPAAYGITDAKYLYSPATLESMKQNTADQNQLAQELTSFDPALLDANQKLTLRVLQSFLKTQQKADGLELYTQPLAPTIGVQAELPMLLCEYTFREKQDVEDYLMLLEHIDTYYGEILEFQQEKSAAGLMMSDTTLNHVIESCESYLLVPGNNFMIDTFKQRLEEIPDLSEEEKNAFYARNEAALEQHFVPAYQLLIDGLEKLKGTGLNEKGMCGYPEGKKYYEYLVFSKTGTSFPSVKELLSAIEETIEKNLEETSRLLSEHPELATSLGSYQFRQTEPQAIMEELKTLTSRDFPSLPECNYTLKDVPSALGLSLSPAFYLTSPIDDASRNVIYINRNPRFEEQQLYNLIAHEGYPGHLYQNVYFHCNCESDLRKLVNFPGYSEGWATYVEHLSYGLDNGLDPSMSKLLAANSMATLGLHAYLDIAVNYLGWEPAHVQEYLSQFYNDTDELASVMFETMVENPANYLSYFVGCMEFQNMRQTAMEQLGERFDAHEFHKFLLDIGDAPFDVIQAYFTSWLLEQKP